jgi:trigger factor
MNVVVEPLPNCLATLRVEVDPERVTQAIDQLVKEFGQNAKVPGYRPGKAPRAFVEKKFKKQIREELEGKLLRESTREAIQSKNLRVLQISNVEDVQLGEDNRMSFTATVVTQPEFELPEYKGLPIELGSSEVDDKDIDASLDNLREQAADFTDVAGRAAQMEDYVVVDYSGTIEGKPVHELFPKAGKPLSGNDEFWVKMTDEAFFPGYCANLVGANIGEVREFDVVVPADFPVEGMPGVSIHYQVTLKGVKEKQLPALDDAFAGTVLKGKTLEELRALAREELGRQKLNEVETSKRTQIMKQLLSKVECELPLNLVRSETQRILSDVIRENQARGVTEDLLKQSEKELVGMASQNAREKLKGTFILLRIAEKEEIRVGREEVFGRIAAMAEHYKLTFEKMVKELEKSNGIDQLSEEILTAKTLEFLVSSASVSNAPAAN